MSRESLRRDLKSEKVIVKGLDTKLIAETIHVYESVTSTNDIVRSLQSKNPSKNFLVVAHAQTSGRGRMGRSWSSPRNRGLYFSLILHPPYTINACSALSLVTALSIVTVLRKSYNVNAVIKWPNDIYVSKKKVGGILLEAEESNDKYCSIIVGIGLNIDHSSDSLPPEAVGLSQFAKCRINKHKMLADIIHQLDYDYSFFYDGEIDLLHKRWESMLSLELTDIGKDVKKENLIGTDSRGALVFKDEYGQESQVFSQNF